MMISKQFFLKLIVFNTHSLNLGWNNFHAIGFSLSIRFLGSKVPAIRSRPGYPAWNKNSCSNAQIPCCHGSIRTLGAGGL